MSMGHNNILIGYKFKVYRFDWVAVFVNPVERWERVIVNNPEELREFYDNHRGSIYIGYNSRTYDQFIFKGILCGFNPKEIDDHIVKHNKSGWSFSSFLRNVTILGYDVANINDNSLESLESYLGADIRATSIPDDIRRPLTQQELDEAAARCIYDVEQILNVFVERKEEFNAHLALIETFRCPLVYISKTTAQLAASILECNSQFFSDEWDVTFIPTLQLNRYASVKTWFEQQLKNKDYSASLKIDIAGVPHVFRWGGAHGARAKYHGKGLILHIDAHSFYPSIILEYGFLTRSCKTPETYNSTYATRLELKRSGKTKEQEPYKLFINAVNGITKDRNSPAYDPRQANNVSVNGQLLILDLIEHLEVIRGFELINTNTDGIIIKIPDTDEAFRQADDICYEYEKRTRIRLSFEVADYIYQKDVNNYLYHLTDIEDNGPKRNTLVRKGAYLKEYNKLDNDLTIVKTAVAEYMTHGTPVEQTINSCTELSMFQHVVTITNVNQHLCWNGIVIDGRTFRIFASKCYTDGPISKRDAKSLATEKFSDTPERCFIENNDISSAVVPDKLDKQWYIELAKKRLRHFGLEVY